MYRFNKTWVVYLFFSTSNHNHCLTIFKEAWLYIFSFLHQTTTNLTIHSILALLYIFSFLHQTTTIANVGFFNRGCISFLFYIKPQLSRSNGLLFLVVYLFFSTSNHNRASSRLHCLHVVYLFFSTSNHNSFFEVSLKELLYIFSFLHQTTTLF